MNISNGDPYKNDLLDWVRAPRTEETADLARVNGQADVGAAFVTRHDFEVRIQSIAQKDRRMLQRRIGNGTEDGLFRPGSDELAESRDPRAACDDHDIDLGYWYRE